jgi:hypothetical protein
MPGVLLGVHCTKNVGSAKLWAVIAHAERLLPKQGGDASLQLFGVTRINKVVGAWGFGPVAASGNLPLAGRGLV